MSLADLEHLFVSYPLQLHEGFSVTNREIRLRVALTRKTRTEIIQENALIVELLCNLAGTQFVLPSTNGWWSKYL